MQPVEHLQALERRDPVERRNPGLEDLDATGRTIRTALAGALQAIGPGRVGAADETEPSVGRRRSLNHHLARPDLVQPNHATRLYWSTATMPSEAFMTA